MGAPVARISCLWEKTMQQQVKILGILNIVMGSLGLLAALVVLLVFGGLSVAGFLADSHAEGLFAGGFFVILGAIITIILVLLSLPSFIAGIGLLKFRPWARIMTIILSAFHLFNVPLGTALGIYGFLVLLTPEGEAVFRDPAAAGTPRSY